MIVYFNACVPIVKTLKYILLWMCLFHFSSLISLILSLYIVFPSATFSLSLLFASTINLIKPVAFWNYCHQTKLRHNYKVHMYIRVGFFNQKVNTLNIRLNNQNRSVLLLLLLPVFFTIRFCYWKDNQSIKISSYNMVRWCNEILCVNCNVLFLLTWSGKENFKLCCYD